MWCVKIMKIMSKIQMMFQPKIKRIKAQTQWPYLNLVTKQKIQDVIGMIAKIKLTIHDNPK